ncbi:MAG: hypothetical protein HC788_05315 [Sphingopyxis sp.]|nr:hypothetical protein [Sphingopyxis sp.]
MGRRSGAAEENHWPGFVDVLSTIVMVVTFLLIIMAIALSVISQNVAKSFIASVAEKTAQGGGDIVSAAELSASNEFASETQAEKPDPQAKPVTAPPSAPNAAESEAAASAAAASSAASVAANDAPADAENTAPESSQDKQADASFAPQLAEELKSSQQADAGKEMAVLSREVLKEEKTDCGCVTRPDHRRRRNNACPAFFHTADAAI